MTSFTPKSMSIFISESTMCDTITFSSGDVSCRAFSASSIVLLKLFPIGIGTMERLFHGETDSFKVVLWLEGVRGKKLSWMGVGDICGGEGGTFSSYTTVSFLLGVKSSIDGDIKTLSSG